VQGYAYDALLRAAELYRALGRPEAEASALETRAAALRAAIDERYWLPDRGYWAMALDGRKQPVDALTSNPAHLLWSGAAAPERAAAAARVILGPELFSGFGLRTMGTAERAYSPIAYHNGSVWPHDTSLAAAGLARYGLRAEAGQLCGALVAAAAHYDARRLPELFAGFAREGTPFPVEYPTSNSPQAWAAGALLLAVTTMLGLDTSLSERRLRLRPALPERLRSLRVSGLSLAGAPLDVEVRREGDRVRALVHAAPAGFAIEGEEG